MTSQLVSELVAAGPVGRADLHRAQLQQHFAQAISEIITPFMRSQPENHLDHLVQIIRLAIDIDKKVSEALPRFSWVFSPNIIEGRFDFSLEQENLMMLYPGEKTAEKLPQGGKAEVYLVVVPGIWRRGEEDGSLTSFAQDTWVTPMQVSCQKPKRQRKFVTGNVHLAPGGPTNGNGNVSDTTTFADSSSPAPPSQQCY